MSEKRFTYGETIDYNFFDVFEEKKYLGMIQRDSTKIVDRLNEQQATITKLKELNGDKGKRIISLIRTNKTLKEENEQLRGINKEIGDDLYNCRLNKDIVSEKLKLWQDTLAEYDIYTIKDFEELMKNDN